MSLPDPVYLKAIAIGILMAAAWPAGTVWVVRASLVGGVRGGALSVAGLAIAQGGWAVPALLVAGAIPWTRWPWLEGVGRGLACALLVALAWSLRRAPRLRTLQGDVPVPLDAREHLRQTLRAAWAAPWRISAHASMALALGLAQGGPRIGQLLLASAVVPMAGALWHGFYVLLSYVFGREVPEDICLYSLNKLRPLAFMILLGLALIALLPLMLATV